MIRALIVDDERLARHRLRRLLEGSGRVEVTGECANGEGAVRALRDNAPDVVFLDVEMPGLDGFSVIEEVGPHEMPAVVFVTAYEQYAVKAFEVHALDYLVKPVAESRLWEAVDRLPTGTVNLERRLQSVVQSRAREPMRRFTVKSGGRTLVVPVEDVDVIRAEGNYVRLHSRDRSYLVRETMAGLQRKLDASQYLRIHRSVILRAGCIREVATTSDREYEVKLLDGGCFRVGRKFRRHLKKLSGN